MCGRFYVDDETAHEIDKIARQIDARLKNQVNIDSLGPIGNRDIHPQDTAIILRGKEDHLALDQYKWGYARTDKNNKSCVINARSETVNQTSLFRDSFQSRRCIIPARGFYEWDKDKNQYGFVSSSGELMLLAGIYNIYENVPCYVIITTAPNESMKRIHDRMPLILDKNEVYDWIFCYDKSLELLDKSQDQLMSHPISEYEQQTLIFE